jgi:hypothetical protein
MVSVHARARRVAVAFVAAFLGLFLTASPAAAQSLVWVGIANSGPDSVTVAVTQGPGTASVNLTSGCGTAPAPGFSFVVCLPTGGYMAFSTGPAPAAD